MSQEPKATGRRDLLKYLAAIVGTGVIVGAGTYLLAPSKEVTTTVTTTVGAGGVVTTTVTSTIGGTTVKPEVEYTFWMADHGSPGSSFWAPAYKGAEDAIKILSASGLAKINLKHTYTNEDYAKEADDLRTAVASKPDGILFTVPSDPMLFDAIVRDGVKKGIPFIALNCNDPRPPEQMMPYLFYVGENAYEVGPALGRDLARWISEHGSFQPKNALLCNPVAGHYIWETRLRLFGEFCKKTWNTNVVTQITGIELPKYPEIIRALLTQYPNTDLIVASGGAIDAMWSVFAELGKKPGKDILVVGIDPTAGVMQRIKSGEIVCCFDQQQYLQGFIPVLMMYMYLRHGFSFYGTVSTGPFIINETNVDRVIKSAEEGFR
ncbi:MAG: substrate-binding domain-containing protein [Nitrososphaeria archaeon]